MRDMVKGLIRGSAITLLVVSSSAQMAHAEVSFVSATNSASLVETIDEDGQRVFVFEGIADGESTDLEFAVDTDCPGVAMTGGAEFASNWSCESGAILATITNRGGMSFGPSPEGNPGTFYVTFNDPPAPPGMEAAPEELSGIQISVFGDISSWNLSGDVSDDGATFGVELSGPENGAAHFRMDLPQAAVDYLGGVLGVFVGGKPDPFSAVTTNDDGSVALVVDIASLKSSSAGASRVGTNADIVTKKITTGARVLGVAFGKTSVKTGKSVPMALCAGADFSAGDKIAVKFSMAGKASSLKKSFLLDEVGCARGSVKLKSVAVGTLTAKISYEGDKAKSTVKVTK